MSHTGHYDVVVRDVDHDRVTPWGVGFDSDPPEMRGVRDWGCGELKTAGFDEVKAAIDDPEQYRGVHVATIYVDLDEWSYDIENHVDVDGFSQPESIRERALRYAGTLR